ncbi:MAG: hypothetical protein ACTS5A_01555 [Candidatus Hodgkinia cicadicola]
MRVLKFPTTEIGDFLSKLTWSWDEENAWTDLCYVGAEVVAPTFGESRASADFSGRIDLR